jgi:hypothetical protein
MALAADGDQADNSGATNNNGGLQFLCNQFRRSRYSVAVVTPSNGTLSEIATFQGIPSNNSATSPLYGADNIFGTDFSMGAYSDYSNCTTCTPIKYHFHTSSSVNVLPLYHTNNVILQGLLPGFVTRLSNCPINHDLTPSLTGLTTTVTVNKTIIDVEKVQLLGLMDGGITSEITSFIASPEITSESIRETLLPLSPYLSLTVLDTLLDRVASMNPWHVAEILIYCSPLEPVILKKASVLPSYLFDLINEYQSGENARSVKEFKIREASMNKYRALAQLVELSLPDDSLVLNYDQLEMVLSENSNLLDSKLLYELYRAKQDYTSANEQYSSFLYGKFSPDDELLNQIIYEITSTTGYLNADSLYVQQLKTLISSNSKTSIRARGVLELITHENYYYPIHYPNEERTSYVQDEVRPINIQMLNVFPNPVSTEFRITYSLPFDKKNSFICIYNELGQIVEKIDISRSNGISFLNAGDWSEGLYLFELVVNNRSVETQKVIVKH